MVATVLENKPRLLLVEPSGACIEGTAIAVGKGSQRIQAVLNMGPAAHSAKEAEALAIQALGKAQKWQRDEVLHLKRK